MKRLALPTLAEGISTSRLDVPQFAFPPEEVAAIIAFPESIQRL